MNYEYIIEEGYASIQKYTGKEKKIIIPKTLGGAVVKKIAPYAFSEQRHLKMICLPDEIKWVGAHAFYNCRSLEKLTFSDQLEEIGDGMLKNCYNLETLCMNGDQKNITVLKHILDELDSEIEVIFSGNHLIFPNFAMDYRENTEARTIHQEILGAGYSYRNAVFVTGVAYREYDQLFYRIMADDTKQAVWLALFRLFWPYELLRQAEETYRKFIQENIIVLFAILVEKQALEQAEFLLKQKLVTKQHSMELLKFLSEKEELPFISMLMDYQNENFEIQEESFEL